MAWCRQAIWSLDRNELTIDIRKHAFSNNDDPGQVCPKYIRAAYGKV